ncbi:hypothetical protein PVL29_020903 [Vitis rotundifolia]|uniref:Uncharacterized protein n=1 Tax=Vitis rotundifolia TaxID=103349 RepID=A0AA39DCB2_VITRO|nr:hypothetical protein PVL29_020903 [Vitis rotundifolia]
MGIAEKKMQNKDFVEAHPNVHYKCAGPPNTSFSTYPVVVPGMSQTGSAKPVAPSVQFTPSPSANHDESFSGNVPNAKVLKDQACFSSNTASEQVQEDQAALSITEVVPENKKAGHQLENDNLGSDEPHQS